jgi:hypothetical protein
VVPEIFAVPRTVALVDASGAVDTSTALTDFATGNNPRSAASTNGTDLWVGGAAGGPRYTTLGASTSTELDSGTYKNVRQVEIAGGQLYASADPTKAGLTIGTVGSGTPTTTGQAVTNLPFGTAPGDPYSYSLLTLGNGTAPDTLYVADPTAGAIVKYGLIDGAWTAEGSVLVASAYGITANDDNGTVTIYATSSGSTGTAGTIYKLTDASGVGGTFSGIASVIATLPTNEAVRGVAFVPGTVIGSGGGIKPPAILPTISAGAAGLAAAIDDPTNPTLAVTVGDTAYDASQLTVAATASNPAVATAVSVDGTGADRKLTVTPGVVGTSVITLTVTAPDATTATTQITYGVSASLGTDTRYLDGAGNASATVPVGDGYALVGDDENNVIRLYDLADSGLPVASFDFTSQLPYAGAEIDIEAAARLGDVVYWEGSMSTTDSGDLAPSRSTVFATRISGSGANTTLAYVGSYTGLLGDLLAWDAGNGDTLGLNASAAKGVSGHGADALNVEGLEFAGTGGTAYLGFRAPLQPTSDRHLAMLIPVTNFADLVGGGVHATFGAPVFLDLGGLGIRDIKANADGQYLIIAGSADDTNGSFVLYEWDGNPAHGARATGVTLPNEDGAWEAVVSVPSPLVAGAPVQLVQDDGDYDFYGDGLTSKTGEVTALQKDIVVPFAYALPAPLATTTTVVSSANPVAPMTAVTLTATVTGPADQATPTGTVSFSIGCPSVPLVGGVATCMLPAGTLLAAGSPYTVSVAYAGTDDFASSSTTLSQVVTGAPTSTSAASLTPIPLAGHPVVIGAVVLPTRTVPAAIGGTVTFTVRDATGATVYTTSTPLSRLLPVTGATIPGDVLAIGRYTVSVHYTGDAYYSPSDTTVTFQPKH